ncbi:MAG: hypothetical protein WA021_03120 [Minisyncoccia bacterium]
MRNEPLIDRQHVMMVYNVFLGALGGLAFMFFFYEVRSQSDVIPGLVLGAVGFAIFALFTQATRVTRAFGVICAGLFFYGGVTAIYVLVRFKYPDLFPQASTDEIAVIVAYVVRGCFALIAILAAMLWWRLNPFTPVPMIGLRFMR